MICCRGLLELTTKVVNFISRPSPDFVVIDVWVKDAASTSAELGGMLLQMPFGSPDLFCVSLSPITIPSTIF